MDKNYVLVLTCKIDPHADEVIERVYQKGYGDRLIRLNTEDFLYNCQVIFNGKETVIEIADSEKSISSESIATVWYRRPSPVNIDESFDDYTSNYVALQGDGFLRGFYSQIHETARWINPLPAMSNAKHKLQQLQLAHNVGFSVPKTIVSNNKEIILNFFSNCSRICTKSFADSSLSRSNKVYPFLTQIVEKQFIEKHIESLSICPTLFQEFIEKRFDIRIFVLGQFVQAFEIESQSNDASRNDFRAINPYKLIHRKHNLPFDIETKILEFVRKQNLVFSSMDMVLDNHGCYYFLENNPNGQWLWLEELTGVALCDIFADELISLGN
jgi:hypothetical protein